MLIDERAGISVVTKHFTAAAADVQVAVGAEGDALGFDEAATAGELALKDAGLHCLVTQAHQPTAHTKKTCKCRPFGSG
jgi:hypothetical protein